MLGQGRSELSQIVADDIGIVLEDFGLYVRRYKPSVLSDAVVDVRSTHILVGVADIVRGVVVDGVQAVHKVGHDGCRFSRSSSDGPIDT